MNYIFVALQLTQITDCAHLETVAANENLQLGADFECSTSNQQLQRLSDQLASNHLVTFKADGNQQSTVYREIINTVVSDLRLLLDINQNAASKALFTFATLIRNSAFRNLAVEGRLRSADQVASINLLAQTAENVRLLDISVYFSHSGTKNLNFSWFVVKKADNLQLINATCKILVATLVLNEFELALVNQSTSSVIKSVQLETTVTSEKITTISAFRELLNSTLNSSRFSLQYTHSSTAGRLRLIGICDNFNMSSADQVQMSIGTLQMKCERFTFSTFLEARNATLSNINLRNGLVAINASLFVGGGIAQTLMGGSLSNSSAIWQFSLSGDQLIYFGGIASLVKNATITKVNAQVNLSLTRCRIVSPIFYSLGFGQVNQSMISYLETKGKFEITNSTTFMAGYLGCAVGYSFKNQISYVNSLCSISSDFAGQEESSYGVLGFVDFSGVQQVYSDLTIVISVLSGVESSIGAIGHANNSDFSGINSKISAEVVQFVIFGGIAGILNNSVLESSFSYGTATHKPNGNLAAPFAGLVGKLENSTVRYCYTHLLMKLTSLASLCRLGFSDVARLQKIEEVLCLQAPDQCGSDPMSNICIGAVSSSFRKSVFHLSTNSATILRCIDSTNKKDPNIDSCPEASITIGQLRNSSIVEQLFRPQFWLWDNNSINLGFPFLKNFANYIDGTNFKPIPLLDTDQQLNSNGLAEMKNGPNMCQGVCHGKDFSIFGQPTCEAQFTGNCTTLLCAPNPCQNSGLCGADTTQCACIKPYHGGVLCDTDICSICGPTDQCAQLIQLNFRCEPQACQPGFTGDLCDIRNCSVTGCGFQGVCNGMTVCQCGTDAVPYKNYCYERIPGSNGECFILNSETICLSCVNGFVGELCDQCPALYLMFENACHAPCNSTNCQNGGVCISNKCQCVNQFSPPYCQNCVEGYVVFQSLCEAKCSNNCGSFGTCEASGLCSCQPGYVGLRCDTYDCGLNSRKCNQLGTCSANVCTCFDNATNDAQGNCALSDCVNAVNGECQLGSVQCWEGWEAQWCTQYQCDVSFAQSCGGTGVCDSIAHTCSCPIKLSTERQHFIGGVFQLTNSKLNIRSLCTFGHLGCSCASGVCKCNEGVAFSQLSEGVQVPSGCLLGFSGLKCEICLGDYVMIGKLCLKTCDDCHGVCYFVGLIEIKCDSCFQGYLGSGCDSCENGYMLKQGSCFKICQDCHGSCYFNELSTLICDSCEENFQISSSCRNCIAGFGLVDNQCLKRCTTCTTGDCYHFLDGISCVSCISGYVGSACDRCSNDFMYYQGTCYPRLPNSGGICATVSGSVVCIECFSGFILFQKICEPKCNLPECQTGTCLIQGGGFLCTECQDGYHLHQGKCYKIEFESSVGICFTVDTRYTCLCNSSFTGDNCKECIPGAQLIDGECTTQCLTCEGDCWSGLSRKISCFSCNRGYDLPMCTECSRGYGRDLVTQKCDQCIPPYVNVITLPNFPGKPSSGCIQKCIDCLQGECYIDGAKLICHTCNSGYTGDNCKDCENTVSVGDNCLKQTDNCFDFLGFKICERCDDEHFGDTCQQCNSQLLQIDQCFPLMRTFYGNYLRSSALKQLSGNYQILIHDETSLCKSGFVNLENITCQECAEGYTPINGSCLIKEPETVLAFHGSCFTAFDDDEVICDECSPTFGGTYCDACLSQYTLYRGRCLLTVVTNVGVCVAVEDGSTKCSYCSQGYELTADEQCKKLKILPRFVIPLTATIGVLVLITLLIIGGLYLFKRIAPTAFGMFKRRFKRTIWNVIFNLGLIFMAQLVSMASAVQDMFNDSFDGFMLCVFVASIPFVLCFAFFDNPKHKNFVYLKALDFLYFLVFVGMDILFQVDLYFMMPEPLQSAEQVFKAVSAPLALVIFILFLHFKFDHFQINVIVFSIGFALLILVGSLLVECFSSAAFFNNSSSLQVFFSPITALLSAVMMIVQILVINVVLRRYTEFEALGRQSICQFLISFVVVLIRLPSLVQVVLGMSTQTIVQVILQMFISAFSLFVMKHLTSLELFINMSTASVWVPCVLESISYGVAIDFLITPAFVMLVFVWLGFVSIFVGIIWFYKSENQFYSRQNSDSTKENDTGKYLQQFAQEHLDQLEGVYSVVPQLQQLVTARRTQLLQQRTSLESSRLAGNSLFSSRRNSFDKKYSLFSSRRNSSDKSKAEQQLDYDKDFKLSSDSDEDGDIFVDDI